MTVFNDCEVIAAADDQALELLEEGLTKIEKMHQALKRNLQTTCVAFWHQKTQHTWPKAC